MNKYLNPIPTVDIIIEFNGGVVLIERKNPPYGWAIPGGYVEYGETVETTAVREAKEETGLELEDLRQFHVYSEPRRDPRHHTISIVFIARGKGKLRASSDAQAVKVFTQDSLPAKLAFDHAMILRDYFLGKY